MTLKNAYEEMYSIELRSTVRSMMGSGKGRVTYKELSRRLLEKFEYNIGEKPLIWKINRSTYSASFAMMLIAALGESALPVSDLTGLRPKRREQDL